MPLRLGDTVPDFTADTTEGEIRFHDWIGDRWAILFSHPKDFTPVCTTELGYMAGLKRDFEKRECRIIGLSVDSVADHVRWSKDIKEATGKDLCYPLIGDADLKVAKLYEMLAASANGGSTQRTPQDNQTVRSVFMIGPGKKLRAMLVYPMSSGRNFDEVLRLLDAMQLTDKYQVSTPVNWHPGEDVIVPASMSDEEALRRFPEGWKAPTPPYLRYVSQPH
jgi:thioredoxin-dependent peroxiredoxin